MSLDYQYEKMLQEASYYLDMGRYNQAREKLLKMMEYYPNEGELHYFLANCLYGLDIYEEALTHCEDALRNGFLPEMCYYLMGKINMATGKYVEAEEKYLSALSLNPQNARVMATYGYLMFKTGHDKKADQLIKEALRLEPDDETVLHYNFFYYLARNKKDEQVHTLERYLRISGSEVRKLVNVGLADMFRNDFKSARNNFRQAFVLDPTNSDVLAILQDLEKESHFLFLPHRIIRKLGGGAVVWVSAMVILMALQYFKLTTATTIFALFYIALVAYTWIASLIYKILVRER